MSFALHYKPDVPVAAGSGQDFAAASTYRVPQPRKHSEAKRMASSYDLTRKKLGRRDVGPRLQAALQNVTAKELARATGESVSAAENAKAGRTGMNLAAFFNACREIPELKAMAMELMGVPPADAGVERKLTELVNAVLKRG